MNSTYYYETIARQRLDLTARQARIGYRHREIKTQAQRHLPKVTWPSWQRFATVRPA